MSRRAFLVGLLFLAALGAAGAETAWLQIDDPPPEGEDPAVADPADLVDLFFGPTETELFFRADLAAAADVGNYTYAVLLDYPVGGASADFRLVHAQAGSYLEAWNGTGWAYVEDLAVTEDAANASLVFRVEVASLGNPEGNLQVRFETYAGSVPAGAPLDRAPNGGGYTVTHRTIPNLPGIVLPLFAVALGGSVALLWWRRSRRKTDETL